MRSFVVLAAMTLVVEPALCLGRQSVQAKPEQIIALLYQSQ